MENRALYDLLMDYAAPLFKGLGITTGGILAWFLGRSYQKRKIRAELRISEADASIKEAELEFTKSKNFQAQITFLWEMITNLEKRNKAIEDHNELVLRQNEEVLKRNRELLMENDKLKKKGKECSEVINSLKAKIELLERK